MPSEDASPVATTAPRLVARDRHLSMDGLFQTSSRLQLISGLASILSFGALILIVIDSGRSQFHKLPAVALVATAIQLGACLFAFVGTRLGWISGPWVNRTAIAMLFFLAIGIGLQVNQLPWPKEMFLPGWSPVAVVVLMILILMSFRPKVTLVVGLAATATEVVIIYIYQEAGVIQLPEPHFVAMRVGPNFVGPVIAAIASFFFWRMSAKIDEAEDMGSYRLTGLLGKGGMGEVWRADHRMLKRAAAVKVIHPRLLGQGDAGTAMKRFEKEAQATAQLQSPHTIEIYDFGTTDEGSFFYVMELLDGIDVDALVRRFGAQPADRVVNLLIQACHSLEEAHLRGLIHRDIKPPNIFLCRYGTDVDWVKVLDFGLVKETGLSAGDTRLTMQGAVSGTPAYMAPEQVMGGEIDGRTDLYLLGCVAFYLLTGRDLFEGSVATQVMFAHVNSVADAPSAVSELPIPAELDAIVLSCLAKEAGDRPASAADLARRLRALSIEMGWTEERARQWWDKQLPSTESVTFRTAGTISAKASSA